MYYNDWTASGKCLKRIENYLYYNIYPYYANTHTSTSITGLQTSCYRHEARQIIAENTSSNVGGRGASDIILFTGNGSTGAITKVVRILNLDKPFINEKLRPIIFVGPHEHHSNLLPWRESSAKVITIPETSNGLLNINYLKNELEKIKNLNILKIGSFSAASNVTGILAPVDEITILLHQYNALAFWDYATAAPYIKINMNPVYSKSLGIELFSYQLS